LILVFPFFFGVEFPAVEFILPPMSSPNPRVRRATLEDLPGLKVLWSSMHFPAEQLRSGLPSFNWSNPPTETPGSARHPDPPATCLAA